MSLVQQITNKDEIILIIHSHDPYVNEYKRLIKKMQGKINIKLLINPTKSVSHSYNLGLEAASNDILLFLDDDGIPQNNLIENHIKIYNEFNDVCGVAGAFIPAKIIGNKIMLITVKPTPPVYRAQGIPIDGMEGWYHYITKGGNIRILGNQEYWKKKGVKILPSLLGGGGNMSFLRECLKGVHLDEDQKRAFRFEQLLGVKLLKSRSECKFVFNFDAVTYHLEHGETLSRPRTLKAAIELSAENVLCCFKFKVLLPKRISLAFILFEQLMHLLESIRYALCIPRSARVRYIGELIGVITGLFAGIRYYMRARIS